MEATIKMCPIREIVLCIFHVICMCVGDDLPLEYTVNYRAKDMAARFTQHLTMIYVRRVHRWKFALWRINLKTHPHAKWLEWSRMGRIELHLGLWKWQNL